MWSQCYWEFFSTPFYVYLCPRFCFVSLSVLLLPLSLNLQNAELFPSKFLQKNLHLLFCSLSFYKQTTILSASFRSWNSHKNCLRLWAKISILDNLCLYFYFFITVLRPPPPHPNLQTWWLIYSRLWHELMKFGCWTCSSSERKKKKSLFWNSLYGESLSQFVFGFSLFYFISHLLDEFLFCPLHCKSNKNPFIPSVPLPHPLTPVFYPILTNCLHHSIY